MPGAIRLHQVSKSFGNFEAVKNLSFQVDEGDIYGFLGPNGSGKSTSLRMMMGLIKPSSGEIYFGNQSLLKHRSEIMNQIGCMIEKPDFYNYLSAIDNLKLFERYHGLKYTKKEYDALLEKVGLLGREKDKVKTFSHGMKQRLGLAQVLLHNPAIIILDEPNTGLDPQGILDLRNLMLQLNKEEGKTILFSSHILSEVQEICDSMVVINRGEKVVEGKVSELLSEELLHVRVEAIDHNALKQAISLSSWKEKWSSTEESLLVFSLNKKEIPALVNFLHNHSVEVLRIDYKNPLEEYFLKITQHSS